MEVPVNGMVIMSTDVNDYDKRLVILTKEKGKITIFANGAKRMNSNLRGRVAIGCMGTFEVSEGRNSYNLKNAHITEYFSEIYQDFDAICYMSYFMELADYYTYEGMSCSNILNLLYVSIKALLNKNLDNELIRYIVELKMMHFNGTYPQVFSCNCCGSEENIIYFSAAKGGMICKNCEKKALDLISVGNSTLYTLQFIFTSKLGSLFTFAVTKEVLLQLKLITKRMSLLYIDKKMKSLELLEQTNFS